MRTNYKIRITNDTLQICIHDYNYHMYCRDSPHGARRSCLHQVCDQKVATHEQDILTYVDDQVWDDRCFAHKLPNVMNIICMFVLYGFLQLKVAFALMCDELKVAILNIIANCRVESLRIRVIVLTCTYYNPNC